MQTISDEVREIIMNSLSEDESGQARPPATVSGSFNVVGDHNTVVFPGGELSERQAFIVSALPRLSAADLADIQARVQRALASADTL